MTPEQFTEINLDLDELDRLAQTMAKGLARRDLISAIRRVRRVCADALDDRGAQ
ncbi:hypothetical protein SAMN02983003_1072 [Devosia enhydra]|uniref:Uncharacterized protein n=1 Tax=Devosia enhydra TaxID=665118 RepID=A0A1K2HVB3_9HYPH|nr:hypothetical protein [Devosia enhydra]SFZ82429.1 hypothetical protein SAMN02983003_1072 [Devosia enhydra]